MLRQCRESIVEGGVGGLKGLKQADEGLYGVLCGRKPPVEGEAHVACCGGWTSP